MQYLTSLSYYLLLIAYLLYYSLLLTTTYLLYYSLLLTYLNLYTNLPYYLLLPTYFTTHYLLTYFTFNIFSVLRYLTTYFYLNNSHKIELNQQENTHNSRPKKTRRKLHVEKKMKYTSKLRYSPRKKSDWFHSKRIAWSHISTTTIWEVVACAGFFNYIPPIPQFPNTSKLIARVVFAPANTTTHIDSIPSSMSKTNTKVSHKLSDFKSIDVIV